MHVIALAQTKGGVGKSTAAINLACEAVRCGHSAAILDMDEGQWSAEKWGLQRSGKPPSVKRVDAFGLSSMLAKLRDAETAWAFIDLPGRNTATASSGLSAANFVLIPTRPLKIDAEASVSTVQACARAKKPYAYLVNIAPAQHDKARARRFSEELTAAGQTVCPVIVVQRAIVPDALAEGQCAYEADPKGTSAAEFTALFAWLMEKVS